MCQSPLTAWRKPAETLPESLGTPASFGSISGTLLRRPRTITFRRSEGITGTQFEIPCGKCPECLAQRRKDWSHRIMQEASCHDRNSFITLTYRDSSIPLTDDGKPTLRKTDVQLFLKRLRRSLSDLGILIRFYCVGEYGSRHSRPHYHLVIFGYDFTNDRYPFRRNGKFTDYLSPLLSRLWPHGYHTVNDYNSSSAKYVSGYVTKKLTDNSTPDGVIPSFHTMSNRRGIGYQYFLTNYTSIFNPKRVCMTVSSSLTTHYPAHIPTTYWNWLKDIDPELYVSCKRYVRSYAISRSLERSLPEAVRANNFILTSLAKEVRPYEQALP